MKLRHIKLAGFKSFVDPTVIPLPGQLVGVVGPNGCGKSNIMDAVRWVLGESKASELRGESMQDVIFNGSLQRKPVGRASVELVFDNSEQRLGGQWSQYAEISVRRIITRDGNSVYQINHQVVRRKDIHDIFMGTGLGPRAYAIIGQGMIARIIEARPDELRVFLEEAAGISKYKERRRDTEHRLQSTRENLARVDDILSELTQQLSRLEEQAEVAKQFHQLKAEQDFAQHASWWVKRRDAGLEQARHAQDCQQAQLAIDENGAQLARLQSVLEAQRIEAQEASDALQAAQAQLYQCNAEVGRIEAEIRYVRESRERVEAQLRKLEVDDQQWQANQEAHQATRAKAEQELAQSETALTEAALKVQASAAKLPELEAAAQSAQHQLDALRAELHQTERAIESIEHQRREARRQSTQASERRERLLRERTSLDQPATDALEKLTTEAATLQPRLAELQAEIQQLDTALANDQAPRAAARQHLNEANAELSALKARHEALEALQRAVQSRDALLPWLKRHQLDTLPRLWQQLEVAQGWEKALESVLRQRFTALRLENLDSALQLVRDAPAAGMSFYQASASDSMVADSFSPELTRFVSLVETSDETLRQLLMHWLGPVFIAHSLDDALSRRHLLPPDGFFIEPGGHRVGAHALDLYAADNEQAGLLERQREIDRLSEQLPSRRQAVDDARQALERLERDDQARRAKLPGLRQQQQQVQARAHQCHLEHAKLEQTRQHQIQRVARIDADCQDIDREAQEIAHRLTTLDAAANEETARLAQRRQSFETARGAVQAAQQSLSTGREQQRTAERAHDEVAYAVKMLKQTLESTRAALDSAAAQMSRNQTERLRLREEHGQLDDAQAHDNLQTALERRSEAQTALGAVRITVDELHETLRVTDTQRLTLERALEPLRQQLTQSQLAEQAARLSEQQCAELLAEHQVDVAALVESLTQRSAQFQKPNWLNSETQRLGQAIAALGAVNLAALDELQGAAERKTFLSAQQADLISAIETLEDAIRKIDRETRALLQSTFDTVNQHFGELFPGLFGGGEARLVMTGEEILDAGVQVMAQPPGKRNTSIHLLSGGEKALTAIALVFAIFRLNPAPFCLLDEVDAPLDDANTERFCRMVQQMSTQTQFLFISHNKLAMEMAQQLVGVTMQERGVSRIVAVDLEAAVALTEAAA